MSDIIPLQEKGKPTSAHSTDTHLSHATTPGMTLKRGKNKTNFWIANAETKTCFLCFV